MIGKKRGKKGKKKRIRVHVWRRKKEEKKKRKKEGNAVRMWRRKKEGKKEGNTIAIFSQ